MKPPLNPKKPVVCMRLSHVSSIVYRKIHNQPTNNWTITAEEQDSVGIPIGHQPQRPRPNDWLNELDANEYHVYQPSNVYGTANSKNPCASNQFRCTTSNVCIPLHLRCDNFYHCNDMSDEMGCEQYERRSTTRRPLTSARPSFTTEGPGQLERRNTTRTTGSTSRATESPHWPWPAVTRTTPAARTTETTTTNPITTAGVASRCP